MLSRIISPTEITVMVGDATMTVPSMPAAGWIRAVCDNHELGIVPNTLDSAAYRSVQRLLLIGEIDVEDLVRASHAALEEATGRHWWEAVRLIGACDRPDGELLGEVLLAGVDPERVSIGGWCATVYALLMRGREAADRARMEFSLFEPPPSVKPEDLTDWDTGIPEGFSAELPPGTA